MLNPNEVVNNQHSPVLNPLPATGMVKPPPEAGSLVVIREFPTKERAQLAARWTKGAYDLGRTVANARLIFKVSQPYISAARSGRGDKYTLCSDRLGRDWNRASKAEREAFIIAFRSSIIAHLASKASEELLMAAVSVEAAAVKTNGGAAAHST